MNVSELAKALKNHALLMDQEKTTQINFDELQKDLRQASEVLTKLEEKSNLGEKLLGDFKAEIKRMSLTLSRVKDDPHLFELTQKFVDSDNMRFEDLILLRKQIRSEFDKAFPSKPQAKIMKILPSFNYKIKEFKAGARG